jgi:anti-sigma regulatory factor (Ser/Thr protein kinase)
MSLSQIHGPIVLEGPSDPAALFLVRCLVERITERLAFPREDVTRMTLAVDEACTNVIRHAYGNRRDERITMRFIIQEDRLEIHLRDFGKTPTPEELRPRDLKEIRPGGLGVHFIRASMDEVHYVAPPEGGGMLKLVKFRKQGEDGA